MSECFARILQVTRVTSGLSEDKGRPGNRGQQLPEVSSIGDLVRAVEQSKHREAEAVVGLLYTHAIGVCFWHLAAAEFTALLKADALQAEMKSMITLAAAPALVWCHGCQDSHLLLHLTLDWASPIQTRLFCCKPECCMLRILY